MPSLTNRNYQFAFILVTSLFFFWGFANNLNPILIPHLRKSFTLSILQSSLVDSAVYIGYFVMAIPAGIIMKRFGYKSGIIFGLLLFALGCLLYIPAANTQSYVFFLLAAFIIASGLTLLETAANPYASLLGDAETATQRLNFSQSFNGLAATLAPIIGAEVILTKSFSDTELAAMTEAARKTALASEASSVKIPYLILGSVILLVAIIFYFTKLPEIKGQESKLSTFDGIKKALSHKHLVWGVITQFFYVGAQVCVLSLFVLYAPVAAGITEKEASYYLGWGCGMAFMIGRFAGTFIMKFVAPPKLLSIYAVINILLCLVAIFGHGTITLVAVIGIAFFMSIMFPTIFSLGIKDLGEDTKFGSSLIIMSIVGGAAMPPLFAWIADSTGNIQYGYIVPLICFFVVLYFGLKGYKTDQQAIA
jgi:MFS transporter, FHS family, L-fucose permease